MITSPSKQSPSGALHSRPPLANANTSPTTTLSAESSLPFRHHIQTADDQITTAFPSSSRPVIRGRGASPGKQALTAPKRTYDDDSETDMLPSAAYPRPTPLQATYSTSEQVHSDTSRHTIDSLSLLSDVGVEAPERVSRKKFLQNPDESSVFSVANVASKPLGKDNTSLGVAEAVFGRTSPFLDFSHQQSNRSAFSPTPQHLSFEHGSNSLNASYLTSASPGSPLAKRDVRWRAKNIKQDTEVQADALLRDSLRYESTMIDASYHQHYADVSHSSPAHTNVSNARASSSYLEGGELIHQMKKSLSPSRGLDRPPFDPSGGLNEKREQAASLANASRLEKVSLQKQWLSAFKEDLASQRKREATGKVGTELLKKVKFSQRKAVLDAEAMARREMNVTELGARSDLKSLEIRKRPGAFIRPPSNPSSRAVSPSSQDRESHSPSHAGMLSSTNPKLILRAASQEHDANDIRQPSVSSSAGAPPPPPPTQPRGVDALRIETARTIVHMEGALRESEGSHTDDPDEVLLKPSPMSPAMAPPQPNHDEGHFPVLDLDTHTEGEGGARDATSHYSSSLSPHRPPLASRVISGTPTKEDNGTQSERRTSNSLFPTTSQDRDNASPDTVVAAAVTHHVYVTKQKVEPFNASEYFGSSGRLPLSSEVPELVTENLRLQDVYSRSTEADLRALAAARLEARIQAAVSKTSSQQGHYAENTVAYDQTNFTAISNRDSQSQPPNKRRNSSGRRFEEGTEMRNQSKISAPLLPQSNRSSRSPSVSHIMASAPQPTPSMSKGKSNKRASELQHRSHSTYHQDGHKLLTTADNWLTADDDDQAEGDDRPPADTSLLAFRAKCRQEREEEHGAYTRYLERFVSVDTTQVSTNPNQVTKRGVTITAESSAPAIPPHYMHPLKSHLVMEERKGQYYTKNRERSISEEAFGAHHLFNQHEGRADEASAPTRSRSAGRAVTSERHYQKPTGKYADTFDSRRRAASASHAPLVVPLIYDVNYAKLLHGDVENERDVDRKKAVKRERKAAREQLKAKRKDEEKADKEKARRPRFSLDDDSPSKPTKEEQEQDALTSSEESFSSLESSASSSTPAKDEEGRYQHAVTKSHVNDAAAVTDRSVSTGTRFTLGTKGDLLLERLIEKQKKDIQKYLAERNRPSETADNGNGAAAATAVGAASSSSRNSFPLRRGTDGQLAMPKPTTSPSKAKGKMPSAYKQPINGGGIHVDPLGDLAPLPKNYFDALRQKRKKASDRDIAMGATSPVMNRKGVARSASRPVTHLELTADGQGIQGGWNYYYDSTGISAPRSIQPSVHAPAPTGDAKRRNGRPSAITRKVARDKTMDF